MRTSAAAISLFALYAGYSAEAAELRVPARLNSPQPARAVPAVAPQPEPQKREALPAAPEPPPPAAVPPAAEPENTEPSWIERFGPFIKSQLDTLFTGSTPPPQRCAARARPARSDGAAPCVRPVVKRQHSRNRGADRRWRRPS